MIDFKNKIFVGSNGRKSVYDCVIKKEAKGVVIFVHGYKGFKDWGVWHLVEKKFIQEGYGFVKFNMSHNGGTAEDPIDFPDLEAFGSNQYSYEINDLNLIIADTHRIIHQELNLKIPICLFGHSRGGAIALLAGAENELINKIICLASISDIEARFPTGEDLANWKEEGVQYVLNGRTNQSMPHYYSFYEDFIANKEILDIEKTAKSIDKPILIVHGDMDMSVSVSEGLALAEWTSTELCVIKGAEHTFGASHPWSNDELPEEMNEACVAAIHFLNIEPF